MEEKGGSESLKGRQASSSLVKSELESSEKIKDGTASLDSRDGTGTGEEEEEKVEDPASTHDECLSIYQLPEEVWELILEKVKEDRDKIMCCRASAFFDMILTKSKPIWQFKKFLDVLEHAEYADLTEYLPKRDLLNCRLVCKQWKSDDDNKVPNREYNPLVERVRNDFPSTSEMERCLQFFSDNPSNPFIDRIVHFSNENQEMGFVSKMLQFINKFEKHIWALRIRWLCIRPGQLYEILLTMLAKTANLRHLNVDGRILEVQGFTELEQQTLDELLVEPLPKLPFLKTLFFRPMGNPNPGSRPSVECPASLHSAIMLPYASQITSWSYTMYSWQDDYAQQFVNLEKVIMIDISSAEELEKLLLLTAPIKSMKLMFTPENKTTISLSLLIHVMCKFPLTILTVLLGEEVELVDKDGTAEELISRMSNPTVEEFGLRHGPKFSYNFVKLFPNLSELNVQLSNRLDTYLEGWREEEEEDVQFYKMMEGLKEGELPESNIWNLFPRLVDVNICHFDFRFYMFNIQAKEFEFYVNRHMYDEEEAPIVFIYGKRIGKG